MNTNSAESAIYWQFGFVTGILIALLINWLYTPKKADARPISTNDFREATKQSPASKFAS